MKREVFSLGWGRGDGSTVNFHALSLFFLNLLHYSGRGCALRILSGDLTRQKIIGLHLRTQIDLVQ